MQILKRSITRLLLGGAIVGLAACGGSTATTTQTSVPVPQSTELPATTAAESRPTAADVSKPSTTATTSTTAVATSSGATAATARADRPYAAFAQSQTPEGYYVLGQPDAPVVMTFYSDFM